MARNRILVVGMVDSVHFARWLSQFDNSDYEIRVFPSSYFKRMHPKLQMLTSKTFRVVGSLFSGPFFGYLDYLITLSFAGNSVSRIARRFLLSIYLRWYKPGIIHAIEIQHAGYLVANLRYRAQRQILTNWGSDIYYFQNIEGHRVYIQSALEWATHYSAECSRDYSLARELGFYGVELPKIPNGGGFKSDRQHDGIFEARNQISVKCYGGTFGLGRVALQLTEPILELFNDVNCFYYSVTDDLISEVVRIQNRFPSQVKYSSVRNGISHEALLGELAKSRIYLGLSKSDGLSTSFLEAVLQGAFPIQTSTSCANELMDLGAKGLLVSPEEKDFFEKMIELYFNEEYLESARHVNWSIAEKYLDYDKIKEQASCFYDLATK